MEHGLIVNPNNKLSTLNGNEINEIIKPLVNEIYLFDTFIANRASIKNDSAIKKLTVGETLNLRREDNKFDENAIAIYNESDEKLGYIPEKNNVIFARLMNAGKLLKAKVTKIESNEEYGFVQVSIRIFMMDF